MSSDKKKTSFLGTGWAFPPEFKRGLKTVSMAEGEDDIKQSLEILLSTKVGERLMHPDFGCNLEQMMFEKLDLSLERYMKDLILSAITKYESRIEAEDISFETDKINGCILINVRYIVRTTNTRTNLVYPFYIIEGTNI
ncbi:MAG TPA: GPW/gp25 family protein [Prolixibacteraceae bacterium]|nr:GPW/gp25 family protein [Prolixibacteraceae bacterium]